MKKLMKKLSFVWVVLCLLVIFVSSALAKQEVRLKWWVGTWLWENGKAQKMAEMFHKEYPDIIVEPIPQPYEGYLKKLVTVMRAKNPPDLFNAHVLWMATLAPTGGLMDVTDEIHELGGSGYFFNGPLESTKFKSRYYGFPYRTSAEVLVWNKNLFRAAGLDPETPPRTWSELLWAAKQITEKTGYPGFGISCKEPHASWEFRRLILNFGGDVVDDPVNPTRATIDGKPGILAGQYYQNLVKAGVLPINALANNMDDTKLEFTAGRLGMFVSSTAYFSLFDEAGIDYGVTLIPGHGYGGVGVEPTLAFFIGVSNYTEHKKEALEFVNFLLRPENNTWFTEALPTVRKAAKAPRFDTPKLNVVMQQMEYAAPAMKFVQRAEVCNILEETVQRIVLGEDVERVLDDAAKKIDKILAP